MSVPELPIHITALNVKVLQSFMFTLPIEEIGRDDVHIYVDYAVSQKDNTIVYEAWAQFTNASIRAMVYDGTVPYKNEKSTVKDIICDMNMSEQFYNTVQRFIEHFDN